MENRDCEFYDTRRERGGRSGPNLPLPGASLFREVRVSAAVVWPTSEEGEPWVYHHLGVLRAVRATRGGESAMRSVETRKSSEIGDRPVR